MNRTSSIGSATIVLTVFGLIGKATGFFREVLFANYFGISREYELYLVASVFPITLNSIALYIYQNYFIPAYSKRENIGSEHAVIFSKKNFLNSIIISVFLLILLLLFRIPILKIYIGNQLITEKTQLLFIIFSCSVPLSIVSGFLISYLQTRFDFKSPAMASLSLNIFTIVALIIFRETDITYIALAYLVGITVQTILLIKASHILKLFQYKYPIASDKINSVSSSIIWIVLIEIVGQLYLISDRYFLSRVDEGGIAAINYATTIFVLPISIITISISTAILPKFSRLAAVNSYSELREKITTALVNILLAFIPLTMIFIFWGKEVVRIIYERGNFTTNSTEVTSDVLFYLSISLVFYSIYGIINKLFYIYEKVKTLLIITLLGIVVKIFFNFVLVDSLKQNGLVISTSLSYLLFFISSVVVIQYQLKLIELEKIAKRFILYLSNGFFSFLIVRNLFILVSFESILFDLIKIILFLLLYSYSNQLLKDKYQLLFQNELLRFLLPIKFSGKEI